MRTAGRRRLDVALLGMGAAALGGVAALGGIAGDTERIAGMWVGASLDDAGDAQILEVIDYDFGLAAEKHGIIRRIPGLSRESPVTVFSASAPDGIAEIASVLVDGEPGIDVRIGDPNVTINGRHRYSIAYGLPDLAPAGSLAWDAVGTGWTVAVEETEVHVVAPWRFEDLRCDAGTTGSTGGCALTQPEDGHLVAEIGSLESGEGVTVYAARGAPVPLPERPDPPSSAPPDPGAGLAQPAAVATLAGFGAAAAASRVVRRQGRERVGTGGAADAAWAGGGEPTAEVLLDHEDLGAMATTDFAPPEELRPAEGGVVLAEEVRPEHKVAWLIEAAIGGAVELVEEDGKAVRLVRGTGGAGSTSTILDTAFAGRPAVELGAYDASFARGWSQVGEELERWRAASDLWDHGADRRRAIIRGLGVIAALLGAVGVAAAGAAASRWGTAWLVVVAVAAVVGGAGLAAVVRGWELRVRTPRGSGLYLRVESFRRFLAGSEAFHAEEAAKRGLLREYTAWAVALGEIDRWSRAVAASTVIPQSAGLGYAHMAPLLLASTSSTATAPSSSGSGGGGGGGVGGGGGGGGGGSW